MDDKRIVKRRVTRFALVGIFNTGLDFSILNALVFVFGVPDIAANIVSGTIAASISFFLNHRFVFSASRPKSAQNFLIFLAITMVGLYGLQNLIIYVLTHYLTAPASWCFDLLQWFRAGTFSRDFVRLNFAKVIATLASLTWNYFLYAKYVFKPSSGST